MKFFKKKDVKETQEYKDQAVEAAKGVATVQDVPISKDAAPSPNNLSLEELIITSPDVWFKAQVLLYLQEINRKLDVLVSNNEQS